MTVLRTMAGFVFASAIAAGAAQAQFQPDPAGQQPGQQQGQQAGQAQEQAAFGEAQVRERQGPSIELQEQQQATITAIFRQEHDAPEIIVLETSADQAAQAREILFSPQQSQTRVVTYEGQQHGGQERSLVVIARRQNEDVQVEQISQQEGIIVLGVRREQEQDQQAMQAGEQMPTEQQDQAMAQPDGQQQMQPGAAEQQAQQPHEAADQQQAGQDQQAQQDAQMAAGQEQQPTPDAYDAVLVIFLTSPY
jgi:hypothetical protein